MESAGCGSRPPLSPGACSCDCCARDVPITATGRLVVREMTSKRPTDNSQPDELGLQDTEAQMRRALGLDREPEHPRPADSALEPHPHRRRFVRDGEVPVVIVRNANVAAKDQLQAARNEMRSLAAAKERAERLLVEAQGQIRDLQTKLGHERLARDEAIQHVEANRNVIERALQLVKGELAAEKIMRERAEQAWRDAQGTISTLTEKLHMVQHAAKGAVSTNSSATNRGETAQEGLAPGTRARKLPARHAIEKPKKQRAPKPVRWWLGER